MNLALDMATLDRMIADDAALRRRQRLQPVGGQGDKIFPPTYPGEGRNAPPRHVFERRRLNDSLRWCALVDSVQSQANRLEESLLQLIREGGADIPYLLVDFSADELLGLTEITSLDAPHRAYDAILRDSFLGDQPFPKSELGRRLAQARSEDATALLEASPTALLFGCWHSTGEGGGLGAKFARCLVSEIIAVDTPVEEFLNPRSGEREIRNDGRRTGSRIDPLGVLRKVPVYKGEGGWDVDQAAAGAKAKQVRPSEINHGNIAPSVDALGVTCDYLEHMFVLSFAGLRRLRFGSPSRDRSGRALLASLGLLALAEQDARGYALRSRCDLVCEGRAPLEVVHADGSADSVSLERTAARVLFAEARAVAEQEGFSFPARPVRLRPQPKLVAIVRQSQELALADEGGVEAGEQG